MQIKAIDAVSLKKRIDEGSAMLVDVRETHEYTREHIEGARLVPLSRFDVEDFRQNRDRTVVFYCLSGGRTNANARLFASKAFREAYTLSGGIRAWKAAGLPTKSKHEAAEGGRKRFGWLF